MPKKETTQEQMVIRIQRPLKAAVKAAAAEEEMAINELCRHVLRSYIEDRDRSKRAQNGG